MAVKRKRIPIREILKAAKVTCSGCGAVEKLTVDHVTPLSDGGKDEALNFQFLCEPCQRKRHGHIPKKSLR